MGQKVHPLGFRIDVTQKHRSDWCVIPKFYPHIVMEDQFIRNYFIKGFPHFRISTLRINRVVLVNQITITIITTQQSFFTNKKEIEKDLVSKIKIFRAERYPLAISSNHFKKVENQIRPGEKITKSILLSVNLKLPAGRFRLAAFYAHFLVLEFEKRVPFRKALRKVMRSYRQAPLYYVEGIKIQISGRINGAEIARTEWTRKGRVPLHTLQADIDYSSKSAKTIYGLLGIKIWVFRGIKTTKMRTAFPNKLPLLNLPVNSRKKLKNK